MIKRLENWSIAKIRHSDNTVSVIFHGTVDGKPINFLKVKAFYIKSEVLVTDDHILKLGDPHPEYEKKFANARQIIIAGLQKAMEKQNVKTS